MYFQSLTTFLKEIGDGLEADRVVAPARISDPDPSLIPGIDDLLREPLGGQGISILGGYWSLGKSGYYLANANTGCGKTFMGIASVFAHWTKMGRPPGTRWLVVIPPNGIRDWISEILATIPSSLVRVVKVGHFGAGPRGRRERKGGGSDESGLQVVKLDEQRHITEAGGEERRRFSLNDLRKGSPTFPGYLTDTKLTFFVVTRERVKRQPAWRQATVPVRRLLTGTQLTEARAKRSQDADREQVLKVLLDAGSRTEFLRRRLEGTFQTVETNPDTGRAVHPRKSKPSYDAGTALWQYDSKVGYVWPVATFVARYLKGFFDGVMVDEIHEFNNDSDQGAAISRLIGGGTKFVGLSATLSNGTVQSFRGLLNRLAPRKMNALGYGPNQTGGARRLVRDFGIEETITTTLRLPNGKEEKNTRWREAGGILPHFQTVGFTGAGPIANFTTYLDLEDVLAPQPISYETRLFDVDGPLLEGFDDLHRQFIDHYVNSRFGNNHLQNWALSTLANYLDNPRGWKAIGKEVQVFPKNLPDSLPSAKEQALLEIVRAEISEGRRSMIYFDYTSFGVAQRIQRLLEENGIPCSHLTADINPADRSEWLEAVASSGRMVVLANAELAKTGNLIAFHTAIFFQSSNPRVITRIQAAGRYRRVTSSKPVRIYYFAWKGTVQEAILERTGRKMLAIHLSQGRFVATALETWGEGTADLFRQVMAHPDTISSTKVWEELRQHTLSPEPAAAPPGLARQLPVLEIVAGRKGRKKSWCSSDQLSLFDAFAD